MKDKIEYFGHVFKGGDKYFYCYKDEADLNQQSKGFYDLAECSQEFALKFAEYIVGGMNEWIKTKTHK